MMMMVGSKTVLWTISIWAWMLWCRSGAMAEPNGALVVVEADESFLLTTTTSRNSSSNNNNNSMLRRSNGAEEISTTSSSDSLSVVGAAAAAAAAALESTTASAQSPTTTTVKEERGRRRQLMTLNLVGDANGADGTARLGECEGDCDRDSDCASGLKCFQRTSRQTVPGCTGDRNSYRNRDFCVRDDDDNNNDADNNNDNNTDGGSSSSGSFRIKLYWQQGYYWQEERIERKWCLQCRSRCGTGVEIALRKCGSDNTKFEFVEKSSSQVQVKVSGRDLCMELSASNNRDIKLQPCDNNSRRQLFTAGPGDFNGSKFELQTVHVAGCLSNPHHPRDGELIRRQNCAGARGDTTSYYNKY